MATKDELSDELNEILGTDIDWSRLYADDLEELTAMAKRGDLLEPMAKSMIKRHGKSFVEEQIDEWYPGKYVLG